MFFSRCFTVLVVNSKLKDFAVFSRGVSVFYLSMKKCAGFSTWRSGKVKPIDKNKPTLLEPINTSL